MAPLVPCPTLNNSNRTFGKVVAAMRPKGIRPSVRGVVMKPDRHPHGGGEAVHRLVVTLFTLARKPINKRAETSTQYKKRRSKQAYPNARGHAKKKGALIDARSSMEGPFVTLMSSKRPKPPAESGRKRVIKDLSRRSRLCHQVVGA